MIGIATTFTTFTPGEAEKITDVSPATQRDWRRHGFLPKIDGHARFDGFNLAEIMALKMLSERGVPLKQAAEVGELCARGIMHDALEQADAYEGDHFRVLEWEPGFLEPAATTAAADIEAVDKHIPGLKETIEAARSETGTPADHPGAWPMQADWLRRRVWNKKSLPRAVPARFFIWWANGEHRWDVSLDNAFNKHFSWDDEVGGPVIVLDQHALAGALLDRAKRPLVHVELIENDDE